MRYSATRLVEEMCKNEPYALEASGNLQDLETITPESLFAYYKKMLSEDEIDLYVIGDIDGSKWRHWLTSMCRCKNMSSC